MRKNLTKIVLATILASLPVAADTSGFQYDTKSLFAIEGSYNVTDAQNVNGAGTDVKENFAGLGLKLGAQGENYRVFVGGRAYDIPDFSYAYTYGGELQYMFNFTKVANFFLGVNGGMAVMKRSDEVSSSISIDDPYYGIDMGFNIHVSEMIDIELGGRAIQINNFDNMVTGYTSLIIKYDMD